jgi:hypothetical protein
MLWLTLAAFLGISRAHAQNAQTAACSGVPCTQTHTVAAATKAVPLEYNFTLTASGTYQVTLTDLGAQLTPTAPLQSVALAITGGTTIIGTPLTMAGNAQFTAPAGTYVVHVIGVPGSVAGSGPVGVTISNTADNSQVAAFSGTLAVAPGAVPTNEAVLSDSFMITTAGSYQITQSDLQLPQALPSGGLLTAIVQTGAGLVATLPVAGANSTTVSLQPGAYTVLAIGQSSNTVNAGLFTVQVSAAGAGGAPVYGKTVPIGGVQLLGSPNLAADNYTLTVADLKLPNANALSQVSALATLNGLPAAAAATPGHPAAIAASANTYQVFAVAKAAAASTGSYSVVLQGTSGPAALSLARAVSASGGAVTAYSFDTTLSASGTESLSVTDFNFPNQLTSVTAFAVQAGALLGTVMTAPGAQSLTTAAGPLSVLVLAQPTTGGSLLGVALTPSGAATPAFQVTQGVGQLFASTQISITTAGNYQVTLSDLAFPTLFSTLAAAVTQGASQVGFIYGSGTFSFSATPGNYLINVVAQPDATAGAGTYGVNVATAPPAPTVSLTADATSVSSGSTVHLVWSTENATLCTPSSTPAGAWGSATSEPTSGTATSAALTVATTFTLSCSGVGGNAAQSATVAISAAKSGGGGGGLGTGSLAFLCAVLALCLRARNHPNTRAL